MKQEIDELDRILKKLEQAEKEYEEKLKSTDFTTIINREEIALKEH